MSLESQSNEPTIKRRRKSRAPHSKTGCITCKIRHVKCDERHPFCKKCPAAGWVCDGYAPPPAKPKKPTPKTLVPKPKPRPLTPRSVPSVPAHHIRYMDDQQYQYFKSFCDYAVVQLSDFFESKLWSSTVLQACDSTIPIQHAATAIGALVFRGNPTADANVEMLRREFAYHEYAKAINLTHNSTNKGDQPVRTTLIGCLLFASFELFNGYPETAATQIYSGINLIGEWTLKGAKGHSSTEVDEEIVEAFRRLEFQATAYSEAHSLAYLGSDTNISPESMVLFFSALQEARNSLESLVKQAMQRISSIHPPSTIPHLPSNDTFDEALQQPPGHAELVASFRRWEDAYRLVWDMAHKAEALHLVLGAPSCRLQSLYSHLMHLTKSVDTLYTSEVTEILELLGKLLPYNISAPAPEGGIPLVNSLSGSSGGWNLAGEVVVNDGAWFAKSDSGEEDRLSDELDFVPENSLPRDLDWHFQTDPKDCLPSFEGDFQESWVRRDPSLPWS